MLIRASVNAIDVIFLLEMRGTKSAYNFIIHFRSQFASSLFFADSLKEIPDVQQGIHNATPGSAVYTPMAGLYHVAK